jgi:hypothetical protein
MHGMRDTGEQTLTTMGAVDVCDLIVGNHCALASHADRDVPNQVIGPAGEAVRHRPVDPRDLDSAVSRPDEPEGAFIWKARSARWADDRHLVPTRRNRHAEKVIRSVCSYAAGRAAAHHRERSAAQRKSCQQRPAGRRPGPRRGLGHEHRGFPFIQPPSCDPSLRGALLYCHRPDAGTSSRRTKGVLLAPTPERNRITVTIGVSMITAAPARARRALAPRSPVARMRWTARTVARGGAADRAPTWQGPPARRRRARTCTRAPEPRSIEAPPACTRPPVGPSRSPCAPRCCQRTPRRRTR